MKVTWSNINRISERGRLFYGVASPRRGWDYRPPNKRRKAMIKEALREQKEEMQATLYLRALAEELLPTIRKEVAE